MATKISNHKSKVTIINSLALSQLVYVWSVLHVPSDFIDEVQNLCVAEKGSYKTQNHDCTYL